MDEDDNDVQIDDELDDVPGGDELLPEKHYYMLHKVLYAGRCCAPG